MAHKHEWKLTLYSRGPSGYEGRRVWKKKKCVWSLKSARVHTVEIYTVNHFHWYQYYHGNQDIRKEVFFKYWCQKIWNSNFHFLKFVIKFITWLTRIRKLQWCYLFLFLEEHIPTLLNLAGSHFIVELTLQQAFRGSWSRTIRLHNKTRESAKHKRSLGKELLHFRCCCSRILWLKNSTCGSMPELHMTSLLMYISSQNDTGLTQRLLNRNLFLKYQL